LSPISDDRERVIDFAAAVIERTGAPGHSTKVESKRRGTELMESSGERVDDFVVQRAAVERMRMTDDAEVSGVVRLRSLDERLDRARRPRNHDALGPRLPGRHRQLAALLPEPPGNASLTSSRLRRCT